MKNTNKNKTRVLVSAFKELARNDDPKATSNIAPVKCLDLEIEKEPDVEGDTDGGQDDDRTRTFTISTGAIDRDNDTLDPTGWEIGDFIKGGSVLWAHDRSAPPIAKPLQTWVENGSLKSRAQFTSKEENPFGYMIHKLVDGGYVRGTSVGFSPLQWRYNEERGEWAVDFIRQTLLEWSVVTVPSNPEALTEARSKGIDMGPMLPWLEMALDEGTNLVLPRATLEGMRKSVAEDKTTVVVKDASSDADAGQAKDPDPAPAPAPAPSPPPVATPGPSDEIKELTDKLAAANVRIDALEETTKAAPPAAPVDNDGFELDIEEPVADEIEIDLDADEIKGGLRDALAATIRDSADAIIRKRKGRLD